MNEWVDGFPNWPARSRNGSRFYWLGWRDWLMEWLICTRQGISSFGMTVLKNYWSWMGWWDDVIEGKGVGEMYLRAEEEKEVISWAIWYLGSSGLRKQAKWSESVSEGVRVRESGVELVHYQINQSIKSLTALLRSSNTYTVCTQPRKLPHFLCIYQIKF